MLISKFDLYKREWLDLVFDGKNKNYGAYDLRVHYGDNMLKALAATMVGITVAAISFSIAFSHKSINVPPPIIYDPTPYVAPPTPIKPVEPKLKPPIASLHHAAPPAAPTVAVPTQKFVVPTITDKPVVTEPVKLDPGKAIAAIDNPGKPGTSGQNIIGTPGSSTPNGTGTETGKVDDGSLHSSSDGTLDALPEPFGGTAAWSKFLQRNMHYPNTDVQGRVILGFVVEKDGHLTDIKVLKGIDSQLDAEAVRVLKMAPKWKPGSQNGQPVRVSFTVPIVFQLNEQ